MPTRLALLVALTLIAGCGDASPPASSSSGAPSAQPSGALTLAVIPKSTGGEFWQTVEAGARAAASDLGVTLKWDGTLAETDIAEQNKIIENMINLGVDGLALAPLNTRAQRRAVENTAAAGIPVVIFDSAVEGDAFVSFVATDNTRGGAVGAEGMQQLLGDLAGKRIVVLRYLQGTGSTEQRANGFLDVAKAAGADVVADVYPEDGSVAGAKKTAANTLEGLIQNNTLNVDGIFAANLYTTHGMAAALDDLRRAGVQVNATFVGFDTDPKLVEQLQAGAIHALVAQNPRRMGYLAVETLTRHLRGETVDPFVETAVVLVTQDKLANDPDTRKLVGLE